MFQRKNKAFLRSNIKNSMSSIPSIKKLSNLKNKRVLVRVDFNVAIEKGKVLEEARLRASVPTIELLTKKGAKVILISHLGRPEGKVVSELRHDPVAKALSKILKKEVKKVDFDEMKEQISKMKPGQVVLLENIRFLKDEAKNTGTLAEDLAAFGDMFVLDGFAVAHRASASVVGIAKYLPSYAGLLLEKEIKGLDNVLLKPKKPFVAIIGGAKIETKIPVLKNLLKKADMILIGGGLLNTYLAGKKYGIADSLVDAEFIEQALLYCAKKNVIRPVDVVVGDKKGTEYRIAKIEKKPHEICKKGEMILDIGPESVQLFAEHIRKAKTLVWNGAMGYFEQEPYHIGTMAIATLVAERSKLSAVFGVIGGGETLQAMEILGMTKQVDLVSTGGGAMLEYLAGDTLPGIAALL